MRQKLSHSRSQNAADLEKQAANFAKPFHEPHFSAESAFLPLVLANPHKSGSKKHSSKKSDVNCAWSEWGEWGQCPITCGHGPGARVRIRAQRWVTKSTYVFLLVKGD